MGMMVFHHPLRDVANNESQSVTPFDSPPLPNPPYVFVDAYRADRSCGCRRVLHEDEGQTTSPR